MGMSGQKILRNMFGLDYRSLALLRIGLGLILLANLYVTLPDLRALYTDEGVLPRTILLSSPDRLASQSLYMASGDSWYVYTLFALQVVLAVLLMLFWRARSPDWHARDLVDPVFLMAVVGWILGFATGRFWLDWGLPATLLWLGLEFQKQFEAEKSHGKVLEKKFDELFKRAQENPDLKRPLRDIDLD